MHPFPFWYIFYDVYLHSQSISAEAYFSVVIAVALVLVFLLFSPVVMCDVLLWYL